MLCLPGFLSTGNSKTSTDAAEPIGETLAAKLEAEGLAALQNGEALSIYARPYCERASYFQCHRSDGSSFHGRALVQKAVAKLSKSCQKAFNKLSKSCQKVFKKFSRNFKKFSKSVWKVSKK